MLVASTSIKTPIFSKTARSDKISDYQGKHEREEEPVVGDAPPRAHTLFSNKAYDYLKFLALVLLPALGALYFGVAEIWGLPKAQEVVGTIVVVDTFLGVVLGISSTQYSNSDARFDGEIVVAPNEEGQREANLKLDSSAIATKKEIVVRIDRR